MHMDQLLELPRSLAANGEYARCCAGCAAEAGVAASELRWPYEGALHDGFPLGFVHVEECASPQINIAEVCGGSRNISSSTAQCCCAQEMHDCSILPSDSVDAWRARSARAWAWVEALRTAFAATAIPCAMAACMLLATGPLLARVFPRCSAMHVDHAEDKGGCHQWWGCVAARARMCGASVCGGAVRAGHRLADAACTPWRVWSRDQRQDGLRLLLGAVLPLTLTIAVIVSAVTLQFLAVSCTHQRSLCELNRISYSKWYSRHPADAGVLLCCCCCCCCCHACHDAVEHIFVRVPLRGRHVDCHGCTHDLSSM